MFTLSITADRRHLLSRWALLTSVVLIGSAWYGGSVAHALGIDFSRGALWLVASTGISWCIFGPLLIAVTRKSAIDCADACLVTMVAGIAVLSIGGMVNVAAAGVSGFHAAPFNWAVVGVSNVMMAVVLAKRLGRLRVPWPSTIAVWLLGLDGVGAVMFYLFRHLIGVR